MAITANVYGQFTLDPGANWNYWFYPNNGSFQASSSIDWDRTTMNLIARPWINDSWDIEGDEVIVVLEQDFKTPPSYRHSYRLNIKNSGTTKRTFFVAASELKP